MRVVFGLAAVLITIGVVVVIMKVAVLPSYQQAATVQKEVKPKVQQIAGQDVDGTDARKTISLDAETSGGRMNSVIVTAIDTSGAMARYFGLKKGDSIIEISPQAGAMMPVKEMDSPSNAKDQLLSAFQNSQQIVVVREGQKLTLPQAAAAAPGAAPSASGQPAAAKPAPAPGTSLQQQLDSIKNVPTH